MSVNLKRLIGKSNDATRATLEGAAGLCLARTHYDIEIEHFLLKMLDLADSDIARILYHFGVDGSRLQLELERSLDSLKTGNARTPAFSPTVVKMLTEAWTSASIDFGATRIRTGFLMLALVTADELSRIVREISKELQKIQPDVLREQFANIVAGSAEDEIAVAEESQSLHARPSGYTPNLDQYTVDMTANARAGKIDNVLGRDHEIRQIVDILMRRRQNNPILTGEAGVGKTAVVEGFALRIANGDVPPPLRNVTLRSLDLALLQAGAGIKGEFENRLKSLIAEVKSSPTPIILFIDEAHTMIGAGGAAGQGDAANLLKPALARGEVRTIAATTWSEYKKYFEKDPALARRFQVVKVDEPDELTCAVMLRGIASALEKHHNVRILEEGLASAVRFSHRYIAGRQLPDKAVSVLDTACARLALGQNAVPAAIEDMQRQIDDLAVQQRVLLRESQTGVDHCERLAEIETQHATAVEKHAALSVRFATEKALVTRLRDLRARLETQPPPEDIEALKVESKSLDEQLVVLQGDTPLMRVCVDAQIVGEVISAWTGIPVGNMLKDEVKTILELTSHLGTRIIGQNQALEAITQRIQTSKARLEDPNKPIGVFLLAGPSGVGKTETALALADLLYGGERNLITINMSEFQEANSVSTLKGSPPGWVGYGEGGVLTEAVRRRPYSVVLLDEAEKAHPDVLELFFQVFDKGMMEDAEGREIDFKNATIILTSNAASASLTRLVSDSESAPSSEALVRAMKPELDRIFKPAFLGRMVIVPYLPIRDEAMKTIIRLKLGKIQTRLKRDHRLDLSYDESVIDEIAKRCTEVESGARNVDNILTNTLLPSVSRQILNAIAEGNKLTAIRVSVGDRSAFLYA